MPSNRTRFTPRRNGTSPVVTPREVADAVQGYFFESRLQGMRTKLRKEWLSAHGYPDWTADPEKCCVCGSPALYKWKEAGYCRAHRSRCKI